jgi:predicted DNA-binding transcriptional regulator AlpA
MSESQPKPGPGSGKREPLLIKADEVAHLVSISTRTLWRLVSAGQFPRPVQVGRSTRWRVADVEDWISRRSSETCDAAPKGEESSSSCRPSPD